MKNSPALTIAGAALLALTGCGTNTNAASSETSGAPETRVGKVEPVEGPKVTWDKISTATGWQVVNLTPSTKGTLDEVTAQEKVTSYYYAYGLATLTSPEGREARIWAIVTEPTEDSTVEVVLIDAEGGKELARGEIAD